LIIYTAVMYIVEPLQIAAGTNCDVA